MDSDKLYTLFTAACVRLDRHYDPLLYGTHRVKDNEVRAKLATWAHERWQALFREWLREQKLPSR